MRQAQLMIHVIADDVNRFRRSDDFLALRENYHLTEDSDCDWYSNEVYSQGLVDDVHRMQADKRSAHSLLKDIGAWVEVVQIPKGNKPF